MRILISGAAGFIGFHLAMKRLLQGDTVIGIDNINNYYDVSLKRARLEKLKIFNNFIFCEIDIVDNERLNALFREHQPQRVAHLAAQAGVRYSIDHPQVYLHSNLMGFGVLIEACRQYNVEHLVYASTSSVYGANQNQPSSESERTDHPLSLYAATKKANELMAHAYSSLYALPVTGLRFFTVYGPWGRPDMAFFSFTRDILAGVPIKIFNHGMMKRDFTYIDDIVEGISCALDKIAEGNELWSGLNPDSATSKAPYRIYNIGCAKPVNLMDYISALEKALGRKAIKEFLPMQAGDVLSTHADTTRLQRDLHYMPSVNFEEGVKRFVDWYLSFYHVH